MFPLLLFFFSLLPPLTSAQPNNKPLILLSPYRLEPQPANATLSDWDTAFTTIDASGSASIPGRDIRLPFPGNRSSDWKYTLSVHADVPHAPPRDGFFTATWLQLEAPKELLSSKVIEVVNATSTEANSTREVQVIPGAVDTWEVCTYIYFELNTTITEENVGPGCEGFWKENATRCVNAFEKSLVDGFGGSGKDWERLGLEKSKCGLWLWPDEREYPDCLVGTLSVRTLKQSMASMGSDSSWLGKGNFGYHKWAERGDIHEKGNTTAFDRARKRVFLVGHVWGYKEDPAAEVKIEANVRCLQANGGPKQQSQSAAVSICVSFVLAVAALTSAFVGGW